MTTTLITGGNKGLGHETARQLIAAGHTVWIGARDAHRGRQAAVALGASFVQLDGVVRVTNAFLALLRQAPEPSVVNITSGLGSFTLIHDPARVESQYPLAAYASSKTAVTMLTMQYSKTTPDVRFNAVDPGQTATDFTGHRGHSVEEGAEAVVRVATLGSQTPTGTATDRDGALPW